MKITFVVDDNKKLQPDTEKDRRQWQTLRNKNRPGTRIKFEIFADRSSAQHRMYHAMIEFALFSSERLKTEYQTHEGLHNHYKWVFCFERPQYFQSIPVYKNGEMTMASIPFSESPHGGCDSETMKEYMNAAMDMISKDTGIPLLQLQSESEKHRKYEA
jgi:hypothetical protein